MMSPFEAHILIQQSAASSPSPYSKHLFHHHPSSSSHCSFSPKNRKVGSINPPSGFSSPTTPESLLQSALQSRRLNPNALFQNTSLLSTAIKLNCPNLLKLFLEHGANPNLKSYENGRYEPALITAVRYKSLRSVQILLEHGANLHQTNFYGTDAIFQAVHENSYEILACLLGAESAKQRQLPQRQLESYYHYDQKKDVPTPDSPEESESSSAQLLFCSSSSEAATLAPPESPQSQSQQSIIIQKTSCTKAWPEQESGNKQATSSLFSTLSSPPAEAGEGDEAAAAAVVVPLTVEKLSNNNPKGHSRDYDDGNEKTEDDDDHVLCPFYYALHHSLLSAPKRQCLALLLQLYYKCKCLEEIYSSSCHYNNNWRDNHGREDYTRRILVESESCLENFSPRDKSVPWRRRKADASAAATTFPPAFTGHRNIQNEDDNDGDRVDNNETPLLYPYKVYRIRGKCHAIKENESSSQSRGAATEYVLVLGGPLKLSCITREVIRDQIMRSAQTTCTTSVKAAAASAKAPSCTSTTVAPTTTATSASSSSMPLHLPLQISQPSSNNQGEEASSKNVLVAAQHDSFSTTSKIYRRTRRNFQQSLESLMMPSSLMDYVLYRNIQWEGRTQQQSGNGKQGESNFHNVQLIKRDLKSNINYLAIYIY